MDQPPTPPEERMSSLAPNTVLFILFVVVPGFIAARVYALWCPTQKQEWEKMIPEYIAYSTVNLAVWCWLVLPYLQAPFTAIPAVALWLVLLLVCVVSPAALGYLWYLVRLKLLIKWFNVDHPTKRGWDYLMGSGRSYLVFIRLKSGKCVGGYYGPNSFSSAYPEEPEIFLETLFTTTDAGRFVAVHPLSAGGVFRQSDWESIEFFNITLQENPDGGRTEGTAAVPNHPSD
ncbi:MAG: DUF6338 family protein [Gemmataceae bacterium]